MQVPQWLTLGVAGLVIIFGLYRIKLSLRSDQAEQQAAARRGLFGLPRRTHLLIGAVYLLLGASLVATSFGWNPLSGVFTPAPQPNAPTVPGAVPVSPR